MEGPNRVEPLKKHEIWLKIMTFSVLVGAQNSVEIGLRKGAKKWCKRGILRLTLEDKFLAAFCLKNVASKPLKNPSLLLEMEW